MKKNFSDSKLKYAYDIKKKSRLFLLFFFIVLSGCSTSSRLELFYSGNLNGIIEDCHCPRSTQGSLLNHYTFYKDSIEMSNETQYLFTGNLFAYNRSDRENLVIRDVISMLGYDYISPGRNDFSFIDEMSEVKAVSFNIKGADKYILLQAGDIKIALTGMIDKSFTKYSSSDVIEDKTISELSDFIILLRAKADIVIFVSNLIPDAEKDIFNRVKEIDVMISNTNSKNEEFRFGDRLYLSPGMFGEHFGKLVIEEKNGVIIYNNSFTKLTFEKYKDDLLFKQKTDSLKVKYHIKLKENYSD